MACEIRAETSADVPVIHALTAAAFVGVAHSDQTEPFIVDALREAEALSLSLVAVDGERVVGHVAISPVEIDGVVGGWFGLGPISVLPSEQDAASAAC